MSQFLKTFGLAVVLTGAWISAPLQAREIGTSGLHFRGFGTIGLVSHDGEGLIFHRDINKRLGVEEGEVDFGELSAFGMQLSSRWDSALNFSALAVLSDGHQDNPGDMLKMAAISYDPAAWIQFRLGRVNPRTFFRSDSKLIGFARLWTMPVHEFYGANPVEFIDGGEVNLSFALGPGYLKTNLAHGRVELNGRDPDRSENQFRFENYLGLSLDFEINNWAVRGGYTRSDLRDVRGDVRTFIDQLRALGNSGWNDGLRLASSLEPRNTETQYVTAGLLFNNGRIDFQSEVFRIWGESHIVPDIRSAYLSLGISFGAWTPYSVLANIDHNERPLALTEPLPPIPGIELVANAAVAASIAGVDQRSFSLGIRWDVNANSALKFQSDFKRIDDRKIGLWDAASFSPDDTITVVSASYEFVF